MSKWAHRFKVGKTVWVFGPLQNKAACPMIHSNMQATILEVRDRSDGTFNLRVSLLPQVCAGSNFVYEPDEFSVGWIHSFQTREKPKYA
jgi:NAD(P)H-flavin reductase